MISEKQLEILKFPYEDYDVLGCDGAVRSGKTSIMFLTFIDWAMNNFNNKLFGVAGKTFGAAEKNIIKPYLALTYAQEKYILKWRKSDKILTVTCGNVTNEFEVSGAKDESSYELIQGRTYAGAFEDEVPLFPRSFFDMMLSRCSVEGAKMWFSSNPASPKHWYYTDWICQKERRNMKYIQFQLADNPGLSEKTIQRYMSQYDGVFFKRYILGEWVSADGLVYDFDEDKHVCDEMPDRGIYYVSIDYGIINPFVALVWCIKGNVAYCVDEYYYDYNNYNKQKRNDEEHYAAIDDMLKNYNIELIVIDPSATSFKETINRHGKYYFVNAKNNVINGISNCMTLLGTNYIKINRKCKNFIDEFGLYSWNEDALEDSVIKENDHAMDAFRYFVNTILVYEFDDLNWGKV